MIEIEDFRKIEMKIVKIKKVERVECSQKLLKLEVDVGKPLTIVAGLAETHKPGELVDKSVVLLTNLKPRMIFGIESQGMLVNALYKGKPILLIPDEEVPPGTMIT